MNLLKKYQFEIEEISNMEEVLAIILFGSYSKGRIKPTSDLDICVITKKDIPKKNKIEILASGTEELNLSLFNDLGLSLKYDIMINGKVIFSKIDLTKIKIKTINQWLDFKPLLNRLYQSRGYPKLEI